MKIKTTTVVLLTLGVFMFSFIVTMTIIFCIKGAVPDTLIQYTLGAGGVEAFLLAGIKIAKVVKDDKPNNHPTYKITNHIVHKDDIGGEDHEYDD